MVHLYVSSFNNDTSWVKVPGADVWTLEVGMSIRPDQDKRRKPNHILYDDDGENISEENQYFGELTGLYWLWKHLDYPDDEIIGFCHYSKCLDISAKRIESFLRKRPSDGWIALEPVPICSHRYPEDMVVLADVLSQVPDEKYIEAWNELYNSDGSSKDKNANCHSGQLFYTTMSQFKDYCEFLFDVVFKARQIIGDVDRVPYHKRYCAFFGERLLSVWLRANNATVKPAHIRYDEKPIVYIGRKLAVTLKIDNNKELKYFVRKLRGKTNDGSSWSRV